MPLVRFQESACLDLTATIEELRGEKEAAVATIASLREDLQRLRSDAASMVRRTSRVSPCSVFCFSAQRFTRSCVVSCSRQCGYWFGVPFPDVHPQSLQQSIGTGMSSSASCLGSGISEFNPEMSVSELVFDRRVVAFVTLLPTVACTHLPAGLLRAARGV